MEKVLVIGLGGTGRRVVEEAMALVASDALLELDGAYGFVIFDDGAEEPEDVKTPLFPLVDGKTFIEMCAEINRNPSLDRAEFPKPMRAARTFGEAGLRAYCDFSFLRAYEMGWLSRLATYIKDDMKLKKTDAVTVMITGSLAGTTASGLALSVAGWCRRFLGELVNSVRVEGVWMLADAMVQKGEQVHGAAWCERKLAESYAALREMQAVSGASVGIGNTKIVFEPWVANGTGMNGEPLFNDVVLFDDTDEAEQLARTICARTMSSFSEYCYRETNPTQPLKAVAAGTKVLRYPAEQARTFCVGLAARKMIREQWHIPLPPDVALPNLDDGDAVMMAFAEKFVAFADENMKSDVPLWKQVYDDSLAYDEMAVMLLLEEGKEGRAESFVDELQAHIRAFVDDRVIPAHLRFLCDLDISFKKGEARGQTDLLFKGVTTVFERTEEENYKLLRYLRDFVFPENRLGGIPERLRYGERYICPTAAVYMLCKIALLLRALVDDARQQEVFAELTSSATRDRLYSLATTVDESFILSPVGKEALESLNNAAYVVHEQCREYGALASFKMAHKQFSWECMQLALLLIQTSQEARGQIEERLDKMASPPSTNTVTYLPLDREMLLGAFATMRMDNLSPEELWNGLFETAEAKLRNPTKKGKTEQLVDALMAAMEPRVFEGQENPCNLAKALYAECAQSGEANRAQYVRRRIDALVNETKTHLALASGEEEQTFCAICITLLNELMAFDETAADPQWMMMFSDNEVWVYKERAPVPLENVTALAKESRAAEAYRRQLEREKAEPSATMPLHLDKRWNVLLNE